jgi:hypothetical protein
LRSQWSRLYGSCIDFYMHQCNQCLQSITIAISEFVLYCWNVCSLQLHVILFVRYLKQALYHLAYLLQILSKIIWLSNLWTISLPDESYSGSVSCTLIYIYSLIYFSNISVLLLTSICSQIYLRSQWSRLYGSCIDFYMHQCNQCLQSITIAIRLIKQYWFFFN